MRWKYSWDQLEGKVRRRHLKASERDKQLALISERRTIAALPIAI